jgi:hypothetical protein
LIVAVRECIDSEYTYEPSQQLQLPLRSIQRSFFVYSDSRNENPETVRTADDGSTSVPAYGDTHPFDGGAIATRFRCRKDRDLPTRWTVTVEYSSRDMQGGGGGGSTGTDPLTITRIRVSTREGQRLLDKDIDGKAIKNTAGDLILGITIPWNELQLEFTQYRAPLDATGFRLLAKYRNAINSVAWRGFPQFTARIVSISGQDVKVQGLDLFERTVVVHLTDPLDPHQPDWRLRPMNAGFRYKNALTDEMTHFTDDHTGLPVSQPQKIAINGDRMPDDEDPEYLLVKGYPELPFAVLDL